MQPLSKLSPGDAGRYSRASGRHRRHHHHGRTAAAEYPGVPAGAGRSRDRGRAGYRPARGLGPGVGWLLARSQSRGGRERPGRIRLGGAAGGLGASSRCPILQQAGRQRRSRAAGLRADGDSRRCVSFVRAHVRAAFDLRRPLRWSPARRSWTPASRSWPARSTSTCGPRDGENQRDCSRHCSRIRPRPARARTTASFSWGDSSNDRSVFARLRRTSVGVRNVTRFLDELGDDRPAFVTEAESARGFAELCHRLLTARSS